MARKLKSDKLLFTATLLLVSTGIVMVYSGSAVMAMQRFQNPHLFLVKQVAWALIGSPRCQSSCASIIATIGSRRHLDGAGCGGTGAGSRAVRAAGQRRHPLDWSRSARHPAVRAGQDCGDPFMAALLESGAWIGLTRSATRSCRSGSFSAGRRPGARRADLGTAACIVMIAAMMVFAAGISYRTRSG